MLISPRTFLLWSEQKPIVALTRSEFVELAVELERQLIPFPEMVLPRTVVALVGNRIPLDRGD
jgi:hypothetical protein